MKFTRRKRRFDTKKYRIFAILVFVLCLTVGYSILSVGLGISGAINISRIKDPIIRKTSESDTTAFRGSNYKSRIKAIYLDNEINPPDNVVASWDISEAGNGRVMAYLKFQEDNWCYDLFIQGDGHLYANEDSSYLFSGFGNVNVLEGLDKLDTSRVTNMSHMFYIIGSSSFILNLSDNFDTSNVTDMSWMFFRVGSSNRNLIINLGNKFDTSNVTDMSYMFYNIGYTATDFNLDLGNKFDTSSVTNMSHMFEQIGYESSTITIDFGDKFDTSNVTTMENMFYRAGYKASTSFNLNLGDNFDTKSVTTMRQMFYQAGCLCPGFTLDLGNSFDTSNVTDMYRMFYSTGNKSTVMTLDLGDNLIQVM